MAAPATQSCECAIIGAGPGGLTAAIYLARFHRQVLVFDGGMPRACWSPSNRNYPGFPEGISGEDLVVRFRQQVEAFQVDILQERVTKITRAGAGFCIEAGESVVEARTVLMATGVVDQWPPVLDAKKLAGRYVRTCPICDAYEASGKHVGLIGCGDKVAREALYLHHFTSQVTLFTNDLAAESPISAALLDRLRNEGIEIQEARLQDLEPLEEERVRVLLDDGPATDVDMLFTALGCHVNSELAVAVGASTDEQGYLLTDAYQATTVPGVYAVGDVTAAINQVTVAVGQAAVAATAIHNSLLDF
jgi:thioredoxin reductase (NADPH)